MFQIPRASPAPYATLALLLSVDRLLSADGGTAGSLSETAAVAPGGAPVIATSDDALVAALHISGQLASPTMSVAVGAGSYEVVSRLSRSGWQVFALTDRERVVAAGRRLNKLSIAVILGVLLGASALVSLLLSVTYRPVRGLVEAVAVSEQDTRGDPIAIATEQLKRLVANEDSLRKELQGNLGVLRAATVSQLVTAGATPERPGIWVGSAVDTHDSYRIGVLEVFDAGPLDVGAIVPVVEQAITQSTDMSAARFLVRPSEGEGTITVIAQGLDLGRRLADALAGMEPAGVRVSAGIAEVSSDVSEVPSGYRQACRYADQYVIFGTGRVLGPESVSDAWGARDINVDESRVRDAVLRGEPAAAAAYLNTVGVRLLERRVPAFVACGLAFALGELVLRIAREVDSSADAGPGRTMMQLRRGEAFLEFTRRLVAEISRLATLFSNRLPTETYETVERVRQAIADSYCDAQFSLQNLASDLGLATSTLSRQFKIVTGRSAVRFLSELRVAEAQRLLRQTALPLKDLSLRVGYHNVSSFIRRFRQIAGETPGEFRRRTGPSGTPPSLRE